VAARPDGTIVSDVQSNTAALIVLVTLPRAAGAARPGGSGRRVLLMKSVPLGEEDAGAKTSLLQLSTTQPPRRQRLQTQKTDIVGPIA
jgi:hypothetical protein